MVPLVALLAVAVGLSMSEVVSPNGSLRVTAGRFVEDLLKPGGCGCQGVLRLEPGGPPLATPLPGTTSRDT